jgi:protein-tyrosine phosphatase
MPDHPDRLLPLQGASNFRDLGGYAGDGGRPLRWRRLFRSDHLGALTEADRQLLSTLGVRRAFDFRGVHERAAVPYEVPGLVQHTLSIEPTVVQTLQAVVARGEALTAPVVVGLMNDLYRGLVNDQSHRFAELFGHLLEVDGPAVFHCTAGKDRTGFAAAMILLALGVPRDVVVQDYLLTNRHFRHPPMPPSAIPPDAVAVLWGVQEDFIEAALHAVDTDHGGVERYLAERLKLTPAARQLLRERYLQPA